MKPRPKEPPRKRTPPDGFAASGFYIPSIARVGRKYAAHIREEHRFNYFMQAVCMSRGTTSEPTGELGIREFRLRLNFSDLHRACFRELWNAVEKIASDRDNPYKWLCFEGLLTGGSEVRVDKSGTRCLWPIWAEVVHEIRKRGGPIFTEDTLKTAASRARLTIRQARQSPLGDKER